MSKKKLHNVVVFYEHGCRILPPVADISPYENLPNVAIDASFARLQKHSVPQEYWKLEDGKIREKNEAEKHATDELISELEMSGGVKNPEVIILEKKVEVQVPCIREVEVEVTKIVEKYIYKVPAWSYGLILALALSNLFLLFLR